MSDQDDDKKPSRSPMAGRSGRAGDIGAELGDLDFEPDALLDSLLADDPASTPLPIPGRKPSSTPPARDPQQTLPDQGETANALKRLSEEPPATSQRPGSPFLSKRHFATLPPRNVGPRSTSPQAPKKRSWGGSGRRSWASLRDPSAPPATSSTWGETASEPCA